MIKITCMAFGTLCLTNYVLDISTCTLCVHVNLIMGYYLGRTEAHQEKRKMARKCMHRYWGS